MADLSHDELDLVMMAQVMAGCKSKQSSSRQGKDITRTHTDFFYNGDRICQKTLFLHGIGYWRFKAIKASYLANGLCSRRHGNKGRSTKLGLSLKDIEEVVQFVMNYAGKSIHCRFNVLVQHAYTCTCTVTLIDDAHTTQIQMRCYFLEENKIGFLIFALDTANLVSPYITVEKPE